MAGIVGHDERVHGLAGDLTQALAGDKGLAAGAACHTLGKAHHEAAHDEGEVILGTLAADLLLDLGEGENFALLNSPESR